MICEQLINPNKEGVIDRETAPYYSEKVSENVKYYFIFAMIVLPIGTLLSLLFFYKYEPSFENEEKEKENEFGFEEEKEISIKEEGLKEEFINENGKIKN